MASGAASWDLAGYLDGMGVRDYFGRLYGPDLIATFKMGPEFYTCLLADAGVVADEALVVDDNPEVLRWVAQAGARTSTVRTGSTGGAETTLRIRRLPELLWSEAAERVELPRHVLDQQP